MFNFFYYLLVVLFVWIIPPKANADAITYIKHIENNNLVIIDFAYSGTEILELKPLKLHTQYTIKLKKSKIETIAKNDLLMVGKFYDFKAGNYRPYFTTTQSSSDTDEVSFTLYTEGESGYYSLRFFDLTGMAKPQVDELMTWLKDKNNLTNEPSTVIPSFAQARLILKGPELDEIKELDYGIAFLFYPRIDDKPVPVFMLNGYPYPFIASYRDAYSSPFLSRISVSAGISLESTKDDSGGEYIYFGGVTLPIVYDFGIVLGATSATAKHDTVFAWGVQIGAKTLEKFLGVMKVTKTQNLSLGSK